MSTPESSAAAKPAPFPRSFWTANVTELFERGAYYAMASFVVIYLGQLGFGDTWPSTLNSWLWFLVYFLPVLSGTIADIVGFRKSLLVAFVLLAVGYFCMGFPVWFGGAVLSKQIGDEVTAGASIAAPVLAAILLVGLGGSVIKPCISGTVQKTAGAAGRATKGFAIFYMVINIGSLFGRGVAYFVRTNTGLSFIFAVAMACSVIAFFVVLFVYRDPETEVGFIRDDKPRKSVGRKLADIVLVLGNVRFTLFILASAGFFFIYNQVYNVLPLYVKKVVETDPAMDIYTAANPLVIVCFQLIITHFFGKLPPIKSIIVGIIVIGVAMALNLAPIFLSGGVRSMPIAGWIPIGSIFIVLTVALIAFGELFTSARTYEYIGALSPKGQEGLFLGWANIPMAIGSLLGGPVGAVIFNKVMCHDAVKLESGLLELDPTWNAAGWLLLAGIGLASALGMWLYNRWLKVHPA
jgi:proton-dependent oligopeptide transporter, POT family